jgi:hypothetical protein
MNTFREFHVCRLTSNNSTRIFSSPFSSLFFFLQLVIPSFFFTHSLSLSQLFYLLLFNQTNTVNHHINISSISFQLLRSNGIKNAWHKLCNLKWNHLFMFVVAEIQSSQNSSIKKESNQLDHTIVKLWRFSKIRIELRMFCV